MIARPRAVLFDRDGTLVVDVPYNGNPELVEPMPGAREALDQLRNAGIPTAVVSNQSGIGRGWITPEQCDAVFVRIADLLGPLGPVMICPHTPDTAWFARGFIEPLRDPGDDRRPLMAEVARLSGGAELVLTNWREGHWLYARQPLVHFGMDTPDPLSKALTWLRSHPQAVAMVSAEGLDRCFRREHAREVKGDYEEHWFLVGADADNGQCADDASVPAYRFAWEQPLF